MQQYVFYLYTGSRREFHSYHLKMTGKFKQKEFECEVDFCGNVSLSDQSKLLIDLINLIIFEKQHVSLQFDELNKLANSSENHGHGSLTCSDTETGLAKKVEYRLCIDYSTVF